MSCAFHLKEEYSPIHRYHHIHFTDFFKTRGLNIVLFSIRIFIIPQMPPYSFHKYHHMCKSDCRIRKWQNMQQMKLTITQHMTNI